ncbi:hypothetical protein Q8F55_009289 [Vanrija albida]|uniref:Uncharacterized protein n=1 Tax=Vanrija albida TaxID=181172 RepID=A0ABR3PTE7_9TREE
MYLDERWYDIRDKVGGQVGVDRPARLVVSYSLTAPVDEKKVSVHYSWTPASAGAPAYDEASGMTDTDPSKLHFSWTPAMAGTGTTDDRSGRDEWLRVLKTEGFEAAQAFLGSSDPPALHLRARRDVHRNEPSVICPLVIDAAKTPVRSPVADSHAPEWDKEKVG